MKRTLCILLSLMLAVTGLVGLGVSASAVAVGEIIEFGNYPQTRVSETTALKNAANAATWKSYGYYVGFGGIDGSMAAGDYMQYADFFSGGIKYRAVKFTIFTIYRPQYTSDTSSASNSYQDENGYSTNTTYYFKYEPLKWRVLDPFSGLVMCENIIDSQAYQNVVRKSERDYYVGTTWTYANNWAESTVMRWLENDFYNTAFNAEQKGKIKKTDIDNSAFHSGYSQYDTYSTKQNIYLLSYSEAQNGSYGLSSVTARLAKGTDYAKCQGLYVNVNTGCSFWRLRSAGDSSGRVCRVDYDGRLGSASIVVCTSEGIRPACKLTNLTSDVSQIEEYTVTATVNPTGGGSVTGSGTYFEGQTATLNATANSGYIFSGWYKGSTKVSSDKSYTFTVTENVTYIAKFSALSMTYKVTATANPAEGGTVTGGGSYSAGKTATVTATPKNGWHFIGWFEDNVKVSDNANYSFTVTGYVALSARFERDFKLNVPQSATVGYKSTVTVTATAPELPGGYIVALYDGETLLTAGGDNTIATYKLEKMTASKTLTAKVIDLNGNVQSNAEGKLEKDITITVKTGFFDKVKAFFQGLFGLLPKVELKP